MKVTDEQIVVAVATYRKEVARDTMGPSALRPFARFIDQFLEGNGRKKLSPSRLLARIERLIRQGRLYGLRTWDCPECHRYNIVGAHVTTELICLDCLERFEPGEIRARLLMPSLVVVEDNGREQ